MRIVKILTAISLMALSTTSRANMLLMGRVASKARSIRLLHNRGLTQTTKLSESQTDIFEKCVGQRSQQLEDKMKRLKDESRVVKIQCKQMQEAIEQSQEVLILQHKNLNGYYDILGKSIKINIAVASSCALISWLVYCCD